jgi:hypothetical protein
VEDAGGKVKGQDSLLKPNAWVDEEGEEKDDDAEEEDDDDDESVVVPLKLLKRSDDEQMQRLFKLLRLAPQVWL